MMLFLILDMPPSSTAIIRWMDSHISRCGLQIYHRLRRFQAGRATDTRNAASCFVLQGNRRDVTFSLIGHLSCVHSCFMDKRIVNWLGFIMVLSGLSATSLVAQSAPLFVEYCSIFAPENENQRVSSKALMFYSTVGRVDGGDEFLYSAKCNAPDYFALPEASRQVWRKWDKYLASLEAEKNFVLEIEFEGKLELAGASLFGHLGWTRARVNVSKIRSIRDVSFASDAVRPGFGLPAPLIDREKDLAYKAHVFLSSLYRAGWTVDLSNEVLGDAFVFIDSTGAIHNKMAYLKLPAPGLVFRPPIQETRTSYALKKRAKDVVEFTGTVELTYKDTTKQTIFCDLLFNLRESGWVLDQAKMVSSRK